MHVFLCVSVCRFNRLGRNHSLILCLVVASTHVGLHEHGWAFGLVCHGKHANT